MEILRKLIVGFIIGGAIGAKLGVYISSIYGLGTDFADTQTGFVFGSLLGVIIASSLGLLSIDENAKSRREFTQPILRKPNFKHASKSYELVSKELETV